MGQDIDFEVDLGEIDFHQGTTILICSDGITNMVELDDLRRFLESFEPGDLVKQIDSANQMEGLIIPRQCASEHYNLMLIKFPFLPRDLRKTQITDSTVTIWHKPTMMMVIGIRPQSILKYALNYLPLG